MKNITFEESVLNMDKGDQEFGLTFAQHLVSVFFRSGDDYLHDMVTALRYLNEGGGTVAYTTPSKYIYLNAPKGASIGKSIDRWKFIYIHECMHQIWDTFGVEDTIKDDFGQCDHQILNIASDCVINSFIKKEFRMDYPTNDLITPELLKSEFNVIYDDKKDDQYTLYCKLIKKAKDIENNQDIKNALSQSGQQGQDQQSTGKSGQQNQQDQQGQTGQQGQQNKQGQQGQQDQQGQQGKQSQQDRQGQPDSIKGHGSSESEFEKELKEFQDELTANERLPKDIIDRYKKSSQGTLGDFIRKCRTSKSGYGISSASPMGVDRKKWGTKFMSMATASMRSSVNRIEKEYRKTYSRLKRGTGIISSGQILKKGRVEVKHGATITMKFFIDISGSMGDTSVRNCFKSVWSVCDAIAKQTRNSSAVGEINNLVYPFDDRLHDPVDYGKVPRSGGGTCSFDELLNEMRKENEYTMISAIITDAEWDVNVSDAVSTIRSMPGSVIMITNTTNDSMLDIFKDIESKCNNFKLILADANFTLSI